MGHLTKVTYFGVAGRQARPAATSSNGWSWPLPPCFAVMGTTLSRSVLDRMSDKQFYYWTRRVILAMGAVYIAQGVWQMAAR